MKCQKNKHCVKIAGNQLSPPKGTKFCTGCDKKGKDKRGKNGIKTQSKEWYKINAELEGDSEIGAGRISDTKPIICSNCGTSLVPSGKVGMWNCDCDNSPYTKYRWKEVHLTTREEMFNALQKDIKRRLVMMEKAEKASRNSKLQFD